MNRAPAFQFYVSDFLSDENVMLMGPAERGVYITLLCFCWQEGSIPSDLKKLARLCGIDSQGIAELWPGVQPCFVKANDSADRLINLRLEEERQKQAEYRQKMSDAGKAGAKARYDKGKGNDGQAIAKPRQGHSKQPKPSDSSSSSSPSSDISRSSKGKEANTAQARLGELYRKLWSDTYPDGVPPTVTREQYINLHRLIGEANSEEKVAASLSRFFANRDIPVVEAKHPLPWFIKNFSRYSTNGTPRAVATPAQPLNRTFNIP
ncbi:MAG TPA: DUF1376 domain-containing protein [Tepidisphaeraceae bacterium]|jgi:uncharacterized protein YdaU (DUF1376 family)